ncbi:interleukin-12 subunit alpha [Anolis sagrei]|uniref:interleukin-12 subunit alpha n=1 Tax=Anolis sagrei TaxID=38937 RepID=UPI00351F8162
MPSLRCASNLRQTIPRTGSWILMAFLFTTLPSLFVAYHSPAHARRLNSSERVTNLTHCLTISSNLMVAAENALHQFQNESKCSLDYNIVEDPKNEEKILKACMYESCPSAANEVVNQTLCVKTVYQILKSYVMKMKNYISPDLLDTGNSMLKALNINSKMKGQILPSRQHLLNERFDVPMTQCEMFLVFQQLTQTIDRILHYRKEVEIKYRASNGLEM